MSEGGVCVSATQQTILEHFQPYTVLCEPCSVFLNYFVNPVFHPGFRSNRAIVSKIMSEVSVCARVRVCERV